MTIEQKLSSNPYHYFELPRPQPPELEERERQRAIIALAREVSALDVLTEPPSALTIRAHHRTVDALAMIQAKKNGFIPDTQSFFTTGIVTSPELYEYTAALSLEYYKYHLTYKAEEIVAYEENGRPISYKDDLWGKQAERHARDDALVTTRTLNLSDRPVFLTAFWDDRCQGCAIGKHCRQGILSIPFSHYIPTDINRGSWRVYPKDLRCLYEFMDTAAQTGYKAQPSEVYDEAIFSQEEKKKYAIPIIHSTIVMGIETRLSDYRMYCLTRSSEWFPS